MSPASINTSELIAKNINPLLSSTRDVFEMMLDCTAVRRGLSLKTKNSPDKEFSAVIGITGNASGTIVLIAR